MFFAGRETRIGSQQRDTLSKLPEVAVAFVIGCHSIPLD
jgi:hypothetical protein